MAMEIEYKFKVDREKFFKYIEEKGIKPALHSRQGYINTDNDAISSLRLALIDHYDAEGNVTLEAVLNIKGERIGVTRPEHQMTIDYTHGVTLFNACKEHIEKDRYKFPDEKDETYLWEVDVYTDANSPLVIAEVELEEGIELMKELPDWIGENVSDQDCYYNANLAKHPLTK